MKTIALVFVCALVSGCSIFRVSPRPISGGSSDVVIGQGVNGTAEVAVKNAAPGNPNTPTVTSVRHVKRWEVPALVPAFDATLTSSMGVTQLSSGLVESTEVTTTTGSAHKDSSNEIIAQGKANADAWGRVQWFGIVCLAFAALQLIPQVRLLVGGGKSIMMISAAAGAVFLLAPGILQGNETLVIVLACVGGVVYWLSVRGSYNEGKKDASTPAQ